MIATPKTIQIFLPGGDPQGIRVAEITTRIVQVIEVPRSLLQNFLKMPESGQVAVYFLFGETEDGSEQKVYIGQTGDLRARLVKHNKEKEFWERALIVISRTHSVTQTHALFLEWYCLQTARQAARYADENGTAGTRPHTPAPMEADCMEIFDTGRTLLATLGYPIFDPVAKSPALPIRLETLSVEPLMAAPRPKHGNDAAILSEGEEFLIEVLENTVADDFYYCKSSGVNGRGEYTPEGFVVLKGSVGRKENVPSIIGTAGENLRNRLLQSGVTRIDGDTVVFEKDHLFRSPSMAALSLLGRTNNGWIEWKTKDGRTLDAVKRQMTP